MKIKSTRNCAGSYTVTDGVNEVEVVQVDYGYGVEWMAMCDANNSDPVPTYRDAKASAVYMLENWEELRKV